MSILYRNAKLFVNEGQLDASLSELSVDYSAEILDVTTFGQDTRIKRGGLFMGKISGKGFFDLVGAIGLEPLLFGDVGLDDSVITVFADGITEGSILGAGFAMKGVITEFKIGNPVGAVLQVDFSAESRGVDA